MTFKISVESFEMELNLNFKNQVPNQLYLERFLKYSIQIQ